MRQPARIHEKLYYILIGLLFVTGVLFLMQATYWGTAVWDVYRRVYWYTLLAYTWYIFGLLLWAEVQKKPAPRYNNERISVLIPCFNESNALFAESVNSVLAANGNKEIIIVDDGSTNNNRAYLRRLAESHHVKLHFFHFNQGKRHALHYAIKYIVRSSDYIVTIDSDTVLDKDALLRIVEPLKLPNVGATTGDIRLLNENQNLLTKMIASYYWVGLNIYKKAQSSLGMVVCCSGCLAAYRTDLAKSVIDEFVNQYFMGERCTHSEDRHLTNLVLRNNYQVLYAPEAISYTETPATILGFLKQQQRWKRGYIRESLYTLTYAWRTKPILFFEILVWDLTIPFLAFGLMVMIAVTILTNPLYFVFVVLPAWALFTLIRYLPMVFYAQDKIAGILMYMVFYEVFLYWQLLYALFTVKNKSWITRG